MTMKCQGWRFLALGAHLAARSILVLAGHKEFEIQEEEHEGV